MVNMKSSICFSSGWLIQCGTTVATGIGLRYSESHRPRVRSSPALPARGRGLVDGDAAAFDADIAAGGEVAQDTIDHLARGADARRDVLLRELLGNHQLAVTLHREVEQGARDAPVYVQHGEVAHAAVQPARDAVQV